MNLLNVLCVIAVFLLMAVICTGLHNMVHEETR